MGQHTIQWTVHSVEVSHERRPQKRKPVCYPAIIAYAGGNGIVNCTIRDLTDSGARIAFARHSAFPGRFYLIDVHGRVAYEARVVWSSDEQAGVAFEGTQPIGDAENPPPAFLTRLWMEQAVR